MSMKQFRNIVVTVCLGCLAPSLAVAQPVITTQPTGQFIGPGATAVFSVSATGTPPLTFQLLFDGTADGTAVIGPGNYTFHVGNAQPSNSGFYSISVSNGSGSVTSQVAELKVFVAAPHSLSGLQPQSNGSMGLTFAGETTALFAPYYDLYPLEISSNLVDWAPLTTLQRSNAALDALSFLDTNAPEFSQRFYRTPSNSLPTPDPPPTGPYPVGTLSMLLTNTNRANAKFMVTFWYPAVAQAGVLPAKYVDLQIALDAGYNYYDFANVAGGGNWDNQAAAFYSHSLSNAPFAVNVSKCPIVLYDPGEGGHRRENTDKIEDLASWGYVVAGLDTSDTALSVWPNGTLVTGVDPPATPAGFAAAVAGRILDEQFVLDYLANLSAGDPPLGGHLDLDEVGAFGWSLGGITAAELCVHDPRCKAGAGLDGWCIETNVLHQPLSVPFLFFRSDYGPDPTPWYVSFAPNGLYFDCIEMYNEQTTNAYWVKLVSTVHGNFADYGLIDPVELDQWGTPLSGQFLPGSRVTQILRACLLSFFNNYLKGQDNHLLDGPSSPFPEVIQFLSKLSSSPPPEYPTATLLQGGDSGLYGTTAYGGASGDGTVFQTTTNGTMETLVSFSGSNGSYPLADLVQATNGDFYGTTQFGGTNGNQGTIFEMTPAGNLTTLVSFNGANGSYPLAALVQGIDGNFYGTTEYGGASGDGTVFQMSPTGALTTLVSFNGSDGSSPFGALVQGTNNDFYGTTSGAGASGFGTVFKVSTTGALTTLVSFSGANGETPAGRLVLGINGDFYGTTAYGGDLSVTGFDGPSGAGTVFKMTQSGELTTLVKFTVANGYNPLGGLVQDTSGNFYGTTAGGGAGGGGTVFKITDASVLTTLVSFNGTNGSDPAAGLVQGSDGNFYGTTEYGGTNGFGTVFQVTTNGTLTTLVAF